MKSALLLCLLLVNLIANDEIFAQAPSTPEVVHAYTSFGSGIGNAGFVSSTAPGVDEIYVDGRYFESFWHALRYDAGAGTYVQTYASPNYYQHIRFLSIGDVHPHGGDEIIVVFEYGDIHLHDQRSKELISVFATGVSSVTAFKCFDLDGDGADELAMIGSGGLSLFNPNGSLIANYPSMTGTDIVIGQMDSDPSWEIAVTDGTVLDFDSGLVQCTWPHGFGFQMGLSDFDFDGMDELIFSEIAGFAWAFDIDTCLPKWSFPIFNVGAITVGDSNGDGLDELIIGEAQWGDILSIDLVTQVQNWSIDNPEHGTTSVALADPDRDGQTEVIWGAGATSSGQDNMFVGDIATQTREWESVDHTGPWLGPLLGDVDGDGVEEVVVASMESNSGYDGGLIVVLEQASFVPTVSPETLSGRAISDMNLVDVDGDSDMEILIAGDYWIEVYDYSAAGTFTKVWDYGAYASNPTYISVDAYDIDGDGTLEIIAGTTESAETNIYVYDYNTEAEEWMSAQMGTYWDRAEELAMGDFDGDGQIEIAVMVEDGALYVFANDGTLEVNIPGNFTALQAGPASAGAQLLYLGDATGALTAYRYQSGSYQPVGGLNLLSTYIVGFQLLGSSRIFIGSAGMLSVYQIQGGTLLWQSADYGPYFGEHTIVLDNGDIATGGRGGIYAFGIR